MAEEKSVKLVFSDGSPGVSLPVLPGSVGPEVIDISTLYKKTGKFTYDGIPEHGLLQERHYVH